MSAWVPLLQTLVWAALICLILYAGRGNWGRIMQAVERRISQGDDMTVTGPLGLSAELKRESKGLPRLEPGDEGAGPHPAEATTDRDLASLRAQMGAEQRGVHLVHVVAPADSDGREYEIFAYLHGWGRERFHLPGDLSDVAKAEFFLGPLFTPDHVTLENNRKGRLGFVTSAHAPALCLCKVTFSDGHEAVVSRYLDFEAGGLVRAASNSAEQSGA